MNMKVSLKLSRVSMNMEEATIVAWRKGPGEHFDIGDPLYEIETEKVTMEVEAVCSGMMLEVLVGPGETAKVGQAVCTIEMSPAKRVGEQG